MSVRDRDVSRYAQISPRKINQAAVESWGAHATGITAGFTLGQLNAACLNLTMTDFSSGALNLTAGQLTAEFPDVVRGLEVVLEGGAGTDITGWAKVTVDSPNGGRATKGVTFAYSGGAGFTSVPLNIGVSRVVGIEAAAGGASLAGLSLGLGVSQKLCLRNRPDPDSGAIVHEEGASTLPTDLDNNGLFTPVSSQSAAVSVTVHYGATKA